MRWRKIPERVVFAVRGAFPFPMDMLRYDACWPARECDSHAMGRTFHPETYAETVWLERYGVGVSLTPDRWQSFGWRIVETERHRDALPPEGKAVQS